jgi:hypothetical protein
MKTNFIDREGVNAVGTQVTRLGWIFREQPIMDVGIDAIIEQALKFTPTGQFIGAQIKSGCSHFKGQGNDLVLYISEVHKNYWCSMNIPIILIGYLPEENQIFWKEISTNTIKKTPTKWKIELKKNQALDESSIPQLTRIIEAFRTNKTDIIEHYDAVQETDGNKEYLDVQILTQKTGLLKTSVNAVDKMALHMRDFANFLDQKNILLNDFIKTGQNENHPLVKSVLNSIGNKMAIVSRNLKSEIQIFAATFGTGVAAHDQLYRLLYELDRNTDNYTKTREDLLDLIESIITSIENVTSLRNTIGSMRDVNSKIKSGKKELLSTLEIIISEYQSAQEFCAGLT